MSNMKYIAYAQYSGCEIYFNGLCSTEESQKDFESTPAGSKNMDYSIRFRIDELLRERGQSLYWLARATGISYTTLWRLTKDRALGINFSTLEKMCGTLECQPGDLIELDKGKAGSKTKRAVPSRAVRRTSSLL